VLDFQRQSDGDEACLEMRGRVVTRSSRLHMKVTVRTRIFGFGKHD
jgi:hypothetical protein